MDVIEKLFGIREVSIVLTIGYEGSTIEDFVETLRSAEVQVLIDRKRGFSKRAFSEALKEAGVRYIHLRGLGDPKAGREAARRGDMKAFQKIFRTHLAGESAQLALQEALEITLAERTCLLCFERDHSGCHRSIVAEEMVQRERVQVRHIGVRHGIAKETGNAEFKDRLAYAFG